MFTSSSPCPQDQFAVSYFSTSLIVLIQAYSWEIRLHSLVCCCGLADIVHMATRLHTLRSLLSRAVARYRTGRDNVQALFQLLLARSLSTKLHSVRYTENKKLSRRSLPNDLSQQVVQVPIVLVPDKGRIKIYLFVHYYYRHLSLCIIIIIIFVLDLRFFQKFAARKKDSGESTAESTSIFFYL